MPLLAGTGQVAGLDLDPHHKAAPSVRRSPLDVGDLASREYSSPVPVQLQSGLTAACHRFHRGLVGAEYVAIAHPKKKNFKYFWTWHLGSPPPKPQPKSVPAE